MNVQRFTLTQFLPAPAEEVWAFFADPNNLDALTPPEAGMETPPCEAPVFPGQIIVHRVKLVAGLRGTWVTEITQVDPGRSFVDAQQAGPFRFWRHRHVVVPAPGGCEVQDEIHWALPLDPFSRIALPFVRGKLRGLFAWRKAALERRFGAAGQ